MPLARHVKFQLVLLVFLAISSQALCQKTGDDLKLIRIALRRKGNIFNLYLHNKASYDFTVTVKFSTLKNMNTSVRLPYTKTYAGGSYTHVLRLSIRNPQQAWSYNYRYHYIAGSMHARHDNRYIYSLPYAPGRAFTVTQGFNGSFSHFGNDQYAIDWGMPVGTALHVARAGLVVGVETRYGPGKPDPSYRNKGNFVKIKHRDGTYGEYVHLKKHGAVVKVGQKVRVGQLLGYSGNSGYSSAPHLHFMVYRAVDGFSRQTYPIKFRTFSSRSTTLLQGKRYTALYANGSKIPFAVKKIRLFEGGFTAPKQRHYGTDFPSQARYIYFQLDVHNHLCQIRSNPVAIVGKYYRSSGREMGKTTLSYTIPKNWQTAYLWSGWGWKKPGNWVAGSYLVKLYYQGQQIGKIAFTIN